MTIKEYCTRISQLLKETSETEWAERFENFSKAFDISDTHSVLKKIIGIYAGAGSFNDLVLYKNGILCIEENNDLAELRERLYQEIANNYTRQ